MTREVPDVLIARHGLESLIVRRAPDADCEIRFMYRERTPRLLVWREQQLCVLPWGSRNKRSRLPQTGWCPQESLEAGLWRSLHPEPVEILANSGFDRGVWYLVTEGLRGMLVHDEQNRPHVYLLTQPASHYYKIMTRNERMPVFVGAGI